ncbi:MAG: NYN domain-containing protein, partial [Acidimicrobiales bacterium]
GYGAASKQKARWEKAGVTVSARPLRYPRDWPDSAPEEKGVDVHLAIDYVAMAIWDNYDVGVLVSCDTDLRPALEVVRKLHKRVEVAAWRADNGRSPRLDLPGDSRIWCHWLDLASYGKCADPTDYGDLESN